MKTENTLRNHAKDVIVPIFPEIKALIEKLEVKSSPYILGHLEKGYNEKTFRSQKDWQLQKIRRGLDSIGKASAPDHLAPDLIDHLTPALIL